MKTNKPKKETIYRCPFCSKMPDIDFDELDKDWVALCWQKSHMVRVFAKTRQAVIRRWNKGR